MDSWDFVVMDNMILGQENKILWDEKVYSL